MVVESLRQLTAEIANAATELGEVRDELEQERKTRNEQKQSNDEVFRRLHWLTYVAIALACVTLVLGAVTVALVHARNVDIHARAVAQCKATNDARAGIRGGYDVVFKVLSGLAPPNPPPATVAAIANLHQQFEIAKDGIPNVDCTKVP